MSITRAEEATDSAGSNAAEFDFHYDDVFARIAGRYDRLCDVFSLLIHRHWKREMARRLAREPGDSLVDLASGTGDIPIRLLRELDRGDARQAQDKRIVATDISPQMLAIARRKPQSRDGRISFAIADAHRLEKFETATVDLVSISFGLKIMEREVALSEAFRILRPGGTFYCLEASRIPFAPLHRIYLKYMDICLPLIGWIATRGDRSAYSYFLTGIHEFPDQEALCAELRKAGFHEPSYINLTGGIVALHRASKPNK